MFRFGKAAKAAADAASFCDAVKRSRAHIEFALDGTVIWVNDAFLGTTGYARDEVLGKHHRMFMDPDDAAAPAYAAFWDKLRRGEFVAGSFLRKAKDGRPLWLQACYDPVLGTDGKPAKIIKLAVDVTAETAAAAIDARRLEALYHYQAVIEFDMDGTVVMANDNFLKLMGYTAPEIVGKHHSLFVEPAEARLPAYAAFWDELRRGVVHTAEYKRVTKSGTPVWIQASYSPVVNHRGKVWRVIKIASDATQRIQSTDAIGTAMAQLAEGHLDARLTAPLRPDFEPLRTAFNTMADRFADLIAQLRMTALQINADAGSIAAGGHDLARRAEAQAATLEETAATMEEMTATIRSTASNAEQGTRLAEDAEARADRGRAVVRNAIAAMGAIEESSTKISEITAVINAISFQTNLLALNAAVEAARAGDAGKGFAVVAAEVRTLAQRSSEAASDIGKLIAESTGKVREGAQLVTSSGDALEEIMKSVNALSDRIKEISQATKEQSNGVTEISTGIADLDSITQQNSSLAESNAGTAGALEAQARRLTELIAFFRVVEQGRGGRRAA